VPSTVAVDLELDACVVRVLAAYPLPAWVFDAETLRFLAVNEAAVECYGWSERDFLGMTIADIRPAEELPALAAVLAAPDRPSGRSGPWTHRRADGSTMEVEIVSMGAVQDGRPVRIVTVLNVTERSRLRNVVQRADAVLNATRDAIVTTDTAGVITGWNPGAERLYGFTEAETVGRSILDFVEGELPPVLGQLAVGAHVEPFDVLATVKDGPSIVVHVSLFGLYDHGGALYGVGTVAHDVTETRRREEEASHVRLYDDVTGLANRRLVEQRIREAVAEGSTVAGICVDIDHFRLVNDTWGHTTGDKVLDEIGRRLTALVPAGDTVGRLGADQFMVVRRDASPEDLQRLAEAVVVVLEPPVYVPGRPPITVCPSIGVAMAGGDERPEDLLRDADSAMDRAKEGGRGTIVWFSEELRAEAARRLLLQCDLRAALDEGAITVVYQPIFRLDTGTVVGVEALARWTHPVLGPISPDRFIAIAEEADLICRLGAQVLDQACRDIAAEPDDLGLSVNISTKQLREPGLVQVVESTTRLRGIDPKRLTLEVVESALSDDEVARTTLAELRALGCRISVDDFGTGWSSLSRLKELPIDEVKVDRCFVAGLPHDTADTALVEAVAHVAQALHLDVVAEGVETQEQLAAVTSIGCQHGQGFLLGVPQAR
jgi:diguanylate cyclase (GGDEF)-like protein/PAS domain S-box-containing protein